MSKSLRISFLTFCLLFFVNISPAQKAKPKAAPKPVAQTKVDLGVLRQNTYTNDFFELKIEFPFGWLVGDNELEAKLLELMQPQIKAKNAKNQTSFNQAVQRLTPLLGAYRVLPGSRADNSNLKIVVENLKATPQIKTTADYMVILNNSFKLANLPPGFKVSPVKSEVIDNVKFSYIEISFGLVKKRMYVTVKKRFALLFSIEYYSQEDYDVLYKSLTEADLQYKK